MTKSLKSLSVVGFIAAIVCGCAEGADPAFSLTLSLPEDVVPAGSGVRARIILRNTSGQVLGFSRMVTPGVGDVGIEKATVLDASGKPSPYTELGASVSKRELLHDGSQAYGEGAQVGGHLIHYLLVSALYDLSIPGTYTIHVARYDYESKSWVESNGATVTVTPPERVANDQTARPPAFMNIEAVNGTVKVGDPVPVAITIRNLSSHWLPFPPHHEPDPETVAAAYGTVVRDERGTPVPRLPKTARMPRRPFAPRGPFGEGGPVQPGATRDYEIDLSTVYDLSKPGKYTLHLQQEDLDTKTLLRSNAVTVTITP